ncbi:MAG: sel1 repeat family protein, partial [Methylobacillus sp.]|nr:sel1 repeat family protein [Methylobacillus sp.]
MKSALIALILAFGFYAPVCAAEPSASEPSAATTDSIRKQAEQGNAQAQYDLGEMYEWGMHGVERDYAQALFWYRKAAEQGQYLADRKVSLVEEKWRNALGDAELPALRALAKNGNAFAQYELGLRYESGWDVAQDEAAAAEWYRKAAEQGDREAAAGLGSLYADGRGVARDAAQA